MFWGVGQVLTKRGLASASPYFNNLLGAVLASMRGRRIVVVGDVVLDEYLIGRATLVGTRTAGFFLAAGGVPIADDGMLLLPIADLTVDGRRLEGVGVAPDVAVEAKDTYLPGDQQLARAG